MGNDGKHQPPVAKVSAEDKSADFYHVSGEVGAFGEPRIHDGYSGLKRYVIQTKRYRCRSCGKQFESATNHYTTIYTCNFCRKGPADCIELELRTQLERLNQREHEAEQRDKLRGRAGHTKSNSERGGHVNDGRFRAGECHSSGILGPIVTGTERIAAHDDGVDPVVPRARDLGDDPAYTGTIRAGRGGK